MPSSSSFDVAALGALRRQAAQDAPSALKEAAQRFESEFIRMMLKSMREAGGSDPLFGSDQADLYRDLFDGQLALDIARGKGLGLGDLLIRQVQGEGARTTAAQAEFVDRIRPLAEQVARELGVSTRTVIAHAALETGWGRSLPRDADGRSSLNFFGIKAARGGRDAVEAKTNEFEGGELVQRVERFRSYASLEEGFADYARLLGRERYAAARGVGDDPAAFGAALQRAGYATDPDYASKLARVAASLGERA
ncbi:MAG: flagellar assembly peptidoglycan hydrolase FlgJ [Gammaproteobacteria bacterium]|nr:flagellar assembly peptidoglycan hydrolase FlgJ [Gammaproteobacteria bacterium]